MAPEQRAHSSSNWFWRSPYLLLTLTMLFWSGNFVVGRGVSELVPPIALAFWRWTGGAILVTPLAWPHLRRDLPALRAHWPIVVTLAAVGVAAFNTLVYIGLHSTTAINALLLQSAIPVFILACSFVLFRDRIGVLQIAGVAASLLGVFVIASRGALADLLGLQLHVGDMLVLVACLSYALYSTLLRLRPQVHPLSLLAATFTLGAAILLPFYAWEIASGAVVPFRADALSAIAYVIVFPGFLAYLFYNRGIEILGPNRAGQLIHLMPMIGSLLAIAFLGETFQLFHAVGIALIAAGIVLAGLTKSGS